MNMDVVAVHLQNINSKYNTGQFNWSRQLNSPNTNEFFHSLSIFGKYKMSFDEDKVVLFLECAFLAMACIRDDGHEVPLVFPVDKEGLAKVESHMLHVRFKFVESTIYVEEERKSELGELQ